MAAAVRLAEKGLHVEVFEARPRLGGRAASFRDPDFLPGALKYGDLPAILALSAPHVLWIAGEGDKVPDLVAAAYASAGKPDAVRLVADLSGAIDALVAP